MLAVFLYLVVLFVLFVGVQVLLNREVRGGRRRSRESVARADGREEAGRPASGEPGPRDDH